jgi:hypothetical protein
MNVGVNREQFDGGAGHKAESIDLVEELSEDICRD